MAFKEIRGIQIFTIKNVIEYELQGELSRVSICQFFSVFDEKILFQRLVGFFKGVSNETTVSPKNYKVG